jgi:hypothetical protein
MLQKPSGSRYQLPVEGGAPAVEFFGDFGAGVQVVDPPGREGREAVAPARVDEERVDGLALRGPRHQLDFFRLGVSVGSAQPEVKTK